ncbi:XRE family transcriptional regulator [Actinomadura sp. KC216]|uniref:helix-turn-helix domain-containing protein n=1 Tax=Actinomadura sp. KC216 TaxID=2530370 RepID=UPI001047042D|nr:helix-turn-helix transcriptional regulator [Actinomadura sp. KC216]TDB72305.1 XRE family transcriptional regulator [Actinomadura sp. KC216]
MREHLTEHFGADGSPSEKLRGLIYCVRRRKRSGFEQTVIAERAKLTLGRVQQVLAGDYTRVSWDAVAAVLLVLDADPADLSVAGELYEQISSPGSPWSGGPRGPRGAAVPVRLPATLLTLGVSSPGVTSFWIALPPPTSAGDTGAGGRRHTLSIPAADQPVRKDRTEEDIETIDPMGVQTVAEFTQALELFNLTHGERSLREIVKHCSDVNTELTAETGLEIHPYSTGSYSNLIRDGKKGKLSKKDLVLSYLAGCGATRAELDVWAKAYVRLRTLITRSGDQQ